MSFSFHGSILIDHYSQILLYSNIMIINWHIANIYSIKIDRLNCKPFIVTDEEQRQIAKWLTGEMELYVKSVDMLLECMNHLVHILIKSTV